MKKSIITFATILSVLIPSFAYADISSNLNLYHRYDEGSGSTAIDVTGNGNTGTEVGSPTYVTGQVGPYALFLNAPAHNTGKYVTVPNSSFVNLSGSDATFSMWINPVVNNWSTNYTSLIAKREVGIGTEYEIYLEQGTGKLGFYNGSLFTTSYIPPTNTWTLITVTISGTTCTFYANGVSQGSMSACSIGANNAASFLIGWFDDGGSDQGQFDGTIDDVRVYNRALSQADINELYAYTGPFNAPNTIGPVNMLVHLNNTTIGGNISTSTLNSGTAGGAPFFALGERGGATSTLLGVTYGASQNPLPSAVQVQGITSSVTYPIGTTTHSIVLDNSYNLETMTGGGIGTTSATISGWYTAGQAPNLLSAQTFDPVFMFDSFGGFAGMQMKNGDPGTNSYILHIEATNPGTVHSSPITISQNVTYWYSMKMDEGAGLASLAVYDTSCNLIGTTSVAMSTGNNVNSFLIGNNEVGTSTGVTRFEDTVIDATYAKWPLVPCTPNSAPILKFQVKNGEYFSVKNGESFIIN